MSLDALFDALQEGGGHKDGPNPEKVGMRDAKTLDSQLNTHMRLKYKAKERVTFMSNARNGMNDEELTAFVDAERDKRTAKAKTWKTLPVYEKWNLIKAFADPAEHADLRKNFDNGRLTVTYDREEHKVTGVTII